MSEHDDALLDEDFASLPDINDEEYDLDISNDDDATISTQESIDEHLSCDLKSSLEDILELDAFEEFEKNIVVEPQANIFTNIKQENIKTECSNEDDYGVQCNDKVILPIDESNLPEDSCGSEARCRNVRQYEPNRQKHTNIRSNEAEYQQVQSLERECNSRHFDRCVSDENHSYIQPMSYSPSFCQPYFQDERVHLGLNNSSFFNEPYPVDRLNILNEPCPIDRLSNQPVFCHNSYTNYGYHLPVPTCLYHQPCQTPPFTNQVLSMQQSIQLTHGHMPIMTNPPQPISVDSNRQMMYNQNNNYLDSTYYDQPIHTNLNQPQYVLNPMYNQNHSNRQKILVNRHFGPPQTRKNSWLYHEFDKTNLFLKKIASKKINNQSCKSFSGSTRSTTNMDPYSYFSDIWQTKDTCESSSLKRSLSPEVFSEGPIHQKQKSRSMEDANQQGIKRTKICKIGSSRSETKKAPNIRKRNMKLRSNCKRKQKNGETKTKNIDGNNKASIENRKNDTDIKIKKKEKMDLEMIEYCKKIEEQKRQRDKFLQEKEIRRKQLAMEKIGLVSVQTERFTGY